MTIDVAFMPSTYTSKDIRRYEGFKKYRFICYCLVKVGDIIVSPDYNSRMIVTAIYPKDERTVHNGIPLKVIVIDTLNGEKISSVQPNKTEEMTEKRNLSVSLEEAREWYRSNNSTLKKLALTAYSEEELEPGYEAIVLGAKNFMGCTCIEHPTTYGKTLQALNKLNNLAYVFNGGWQKPIGAEGFFIAPWTSVSTGITQYTTGNWSVLSHSNVTYPGIVYFRRKDDAIKAMKIAEKEGWLDDLK